MADDDVQVSIGATIGDLVDGVEQAKGSIEGFGESLKGIAELAGVAFTADAIKEWITSTAELGERGSRESAVGGHPLRIVDLLLDDHIALRHLSASLTGALLERTSSAEGT